ncbi:hypothetical protein Tco_0042973, partial [Tanacetum coccineum]
MATCHHLSGATWRRHCSVTVGQPPLDHRSTVVNCGSQRLSTTINTTGPPPDHRSMATVNGDQHRRTTVDHRLTTGQRRRSTTVNGGGPPLTTAGPPVNQWVMAGYWAGS